MAIQPTGSRGRRGTLGAAAIAVVLLLVGLVALVAGFRGQQGPPMPAELVAAAAPTSGAAPASETPGGAGPTPGRGTPSTPSTGSTRPAAPAARPGQAAAPPASMGRFLPASQPTQLEIPSIGLSARTFVPLRVQGDGSISVPRTADEVGLFDGGPTPGQLGPAVLAAHVDTPSGRRGVFYELGAVKPGATVKVARADGTRLTFTVDRVTAYPKASFPTSLVYYGDYKRPEIRLVTCAGPVDSRNEYRDNVVVFGHLTAVS